MRRVVWLMVACVLVGIAVFAACGDPKTLVHVRFLGVPTAPVAKLSLDLDIMGNKSHYDINAPSDTQPLMFPLERTIEIKAGVQGLLNLHVAVLDANGTAITSDDANGIVTFGKTLDLDVQVGPLAQDGGFGDGGLAKLSIAGPSMKDFGKFILGMNMPAMTWTVTIINEGPEDCGPISVGGMHLLIPPPPPPDLLGLDASGGPDLAMAPPDLAGSPDLGPKPFTLVNDHCTGKTFPKSTGCSFDIEYKPTTAGMYTDTIVVSANPGGTLMLPMMGTAGTNDM